jgi:signal transduction histidine kinase
LFFVKQDVFDSQDCTALIGRLDETAQTVRDLARRLAEDQAQSNGAVARDLNDAVLQKLHSIRQDLLLRSDSAALMRSFDDVIQTLRWTIKGQRPPLLDHGLPLALEGLVEEMRRQAGPAQTISWRSGVSGTLRISDEQATALYRIAQEALSNALRHADAGEIRVTLNAGTGSGIRLCIADDGTGIPASVWKTWDREHHYGLAGMRERAAMIGAGFRIDSTPNGGTEVIVEIGS